MTHKVNKEAAESMAIQALSFIAEESERLGRFLALSGIDPASIRSAAADPNFLVGVLDYVVGDETLVVEFAKTHGFAPEALIAARAALAGRSAQEEQA